MSKLHGISRFLFLLACLAPLAGRVRGAEPGPPRESQRRAAILADIGRLRLELGTADGLRAAISALQEAARLDPANIRARFWLAAAQVRSAAAGGGKLDAEKVGRAGLEFEAVFKLSLLDRSAGAQDLRRRAIAELDDCARRLPASEKRFGPWWKRRRAELLAERPQADLVHVVGRRESFATIARKYYGDGREAGRIARANPKIDPLKLRVGQRVTVPGVALKVPRPEPRLDRVDRQLVERLRTSGVAAARRAAAERLAGRDCLAAVSYLAEALRTDASSWVRAECARSLGRLSDPAAEPGLAAALTADRSAACRREAATALGRVAGRASLPVLLRALADRSAAVAAAAARSLGRRRAAAASGPLTAALSARSETLRRAAAGALGRLAAEGRLAAPDLARIRAVAARGNGPKRAAALLALADADSSAAEKLLPAALGSAEIAVRRAACEAAARLATRGGGLEAGVIKRLAALAGSRDPAVRFGAAAAVARARKGRPAGRRGLLTLAALLGDLRAIAWGDGEPQVVSGLAARELTRLTGKRLAPDSETWRRWLEKR